MKRVMLTLFAVSMLAFFAGAQNLSDKKPEAASETVDNPNAPEITFEKTVHDYGKVEKGGNGECEFKFTNTGKEPLVLSNVRSSCGCTVPKWPREPILPGQSGTINVKYDTRRIGMINKHVTVLSNAKNPSVMLRITGTVTNTPEDTGMPEKSTENSAAPTVK